jgi:hypothetical protein
MWVQTENNGRVKSRGTFPGLQHFGGKGACWNSRMGLGRMTSIYSLTWICTNQTTHWLMHSLGIFGARTNHGQPRIHKTHHGPDLREAITFPLIVFFVPFHGATSKWHFTQLGLPWLWGRITSHANLWLQWSLKQSCSPCRELFNSMSHATCTRGNWIDFWLLMVGSQIVNLIPGLSFGHNLCFGCPNGSWKPILDMYVSISFQWYKELSKLMSFDPYNHALKIWKSIWDFNTQHGSSFESMRVHSLTLFALLDACDVTPGSPSWPATLQPFTLVTSPSLGLRHSPYNVPILSSEGIHDVSNGVMCGYPLTSKWATN